MAVEDCGINRNFQKVRGDDWAFRLEFYKDLERTKPINITNWVVWLTVKNSNDDPDDAAVIQEKLTIASGSDGKATILVPHEKTNIVIKTYCYDFQYRTTEGWVKTFLTGDLEVVNDTTKDDTAEANDE